MGPLAALLPLPPEAGLGPGSDPGSAAAVARDRQRTSCREKPAVRGQEVHGRIGRHGGADVADVARCDSHVSRW